MTNTTDTNLAHALRKMHKRWLDLSATYITNASPSYVLEECASEVEAILTLHDTTRAQPDRGLLTGAHPDGRPYTLHGTPESVEAVSDLIEARAQPASVADGEKIIELLEEVIGIHADDDDPDYHGCDKEQCFWCEQAKEQIALLKAAPQPPATAQENDHD